jgi:nucleoid-associated protein YgaU
MEISRNFGWLGMLALGICCALPYYRPTQPPVAATAAEPTADFHLPEVLNPDPRLQLPVLKKEANARLSPPLLEQPRFSIQPKPPKQPLVSLPDWAAPASNPPAFDAPPPKLTPSIPIFVRKSTPRSSPTTQIAEPKTIAESPPVQAKTRRHRLVDGDSLRLLALRYYGDERHAAEILAANRHVLRNPDLLPIGQELVIPPPRAIP